MGPDFPKQWLRHSLATVKVSDRSHEVRSLEWVRGEMALEIVCYWVERTFLVNKMDNLITLVFYLYYP